MVLVRLSFGDISTYMREKFMVVFVTKFSLLFRLAVAILCTVTRYKKCYTFHVSFLHIKQIGTVFSSMTRYVGYANLCAIYI